MSVSEHDSNDSNSIDSLIARGEGQALEFIDRFPAQVRELAKEAAAFASLGGGTILLGVNNAGGVVGLEGTESLEARDQVLRRVEGVFHGTVKPSITPRLQWINAKGLLVLKIEIIRPTQPLYYVNNVPYIRHITEARPAEPHEVIQLVRSWLANATEEPTSAEEFADEAAFVACWMRVDGEQLRERMMQPHFAGIQIRLQVTSENARVLACNDTSHELGAAEALQSLAWAADEAAALPIALGAHNFAERTRLVNATVDAAHSVVELLGDALPVRPARRVAARRELRQRNRRAAGEVLRASSVIGAHQFSEYRGELALLGAEIAISACWALRGEPVEWRDALYACGQRLHLIDTMPRSPSGYEHIVDAIRQSVDDLATLVARIDHEHPI